MVLDHLTNPKVKSAGFIFLILAVIFAAYVPSLSNNFVNWDDDVHVYDNPFIQSLDFDHLRQIFTSRVNGVYIPLTELSFAVEHHFFRDNPFVYHLTNLFLHILATYLVFLLSGALGLSVLAAGMTALLFGLHPIHVESVAWITERKDVLYAVFYLLSLICYTRYLTRLIGKDSGAWVSLAWASGLGILSMLAKPMAISLPLIWLLLDWWKERDFTLKLILEKAPLAAALGLLAWVTYMTQARLPGQDIKEALLIWPWTFSFYLRQFAVPFVSVPIYRLPKPITLANSEYGLGVLIFAAVVFLVVRFRKNRLFLFAVLYYFLSIFFLLRFDAAADVNIVADRFMYLPCLGLCLLFGSYGGRLLSSTEKSTEYLRKILKAALVVLGIVLFVQTFRQSMLWRDSVTLWRHQLKIFPQEPIALNNLATVLRDVDEFRAAEEQYKLIAKLSQDGLDKNSLNQALADLRPVQYVMSLYFKAVEYDPNYTDAYYNLGKIHQDLGEIQKGIFFYQKALNLDPLYKDALLNLGKSYLQLGLVAEAVDNLNTITALNPKNEDYYLDILLAYHAALKEKGPHPVIEAQFKDLFERYAKLISRNSAKAGSFLNLGSLYQGLGDKSRAVEAYEMALKLSPRNTKALYNLANLYDEKGELNKAISTYQRVLELDPRHDLAYLNLGVAYGKIGRDIEAKAAFEKAVDLNPKNADAHFNLGYIYEKTKQSFAALDAYKEAVRINPRHVESYYNMGNVYFSLDKNREALESYKKALEIDPNHLNAAINLSIAYYRQKDFANALKFLDDARVLGYDAPQEYLEALEPYRK